jgi:hypothetical protein
MGNHYRNLLAAVLVVVTLIIAGVGWMALRGGESHSEVTPPPAPPQVTIPAGANGTAAAAPASTSPPAAPAEAVPSRPVPANAIVGMRVHVAGAVPPATQTTVPTLERRLVLA